MSNKTQLQSNNTKYASLIETLRGKSVPTGEDVTDETNTYTTKIASLESAVTALETELAGKASGGNIETCTVILTCSATGLKGYSSICLEDGEISVTNEILNNVTLGANIYNILKGSILVVQTSTIFKPDYNISDSNVSCLWNTYDGMVWCFYIPPSASNEITITIIEND